MKKLNIGLKTYYLVYLKLFKTSNDNNIKTNEKASNDQYVDI